ncbi:hepatocyte growth factor receptor-like [Planococcus citri]|uniref:hepatocyte growth factor receptor-like n=1 Tax=Planococcus citri TaxID=170843 RepID=UPI0031F90309
MCSFCKTTGFFFILVIYLLSKSVESLPDDGQGMPSSNNGDCSAYTFCAPCIKSNFGCKWCVETRTCSNNDCQTKYVVKGGGCHAKETCDKFNTFHECLESSQFYYCGWCISKNQCTYNTNCSSTGASLWIIKSDIVENSLFEIVNATHLKYGKSENILLHSRTKYSKESLIRAAFKCQLTFANSKLNFPMDTTIVQIQNDSIVSCLLPKSNNILTLSLESYEYTATAIMSLYTNTIQKSPIWSTNVTFFDCRAYHLSKKKCRQDLQCYWCIDKEKCIYSSDREIECPNSPSSWINSFWPEKGLWQGGTNITIQDENFCIELNQCIIRIKVAGRPCKLIRHHDISSKTIKCTIEPSPSYQVSEGKIQVHVDDEVILSDTNFMFVEPDITGIDPKEGFISGGTQLTIKGKHLDAGSSIIVSIGSQPCTIFFYNSSIIQCISNKSNTTAKEDTVSVVFDKYAPNFTNNLYKYVKDEEHDENGFNVQPKGIPQGGIQILLRNIASEHSNELIFNVKYQSNIHNGSCKFQDHSGVICSSPQIPINSNSINVADPIELDFWLTDPTAPELKTPLAKTKSSTFLLYPSPTFDYFSISYVPLTKNHYVIIEGKNINKACQKSDLIVEMRNVLCEVISLTSVRVICVLRKTNSSDCNEAKYEFIGEDENIKITIENNFTVSVPKQRSPSGEYIKNPTSWNIIYVVIAVTAGTFIVVLLITLFICCFCLWNMQIKNVQATMRMEQRVNQMCMETIALRQCIKKIVIENKVELDENSSNMLKLPSVTIEYGPTSDTSIVIDTSPDTEFLVPMDPKWEFPRSNLSFGMSLGEGEFGKVVAAEAFGILHQNLTSTVAVKSLKNGHADADMIDLVYEMEILKLIGSHVNVLQLLGCCTQDGELLIITEFTQHGNLRDFLRNYLPSSEDELLPNNLTRKTLLLFAQQVAKGMEYLASKKCIHRDLAARNVLVADDYIMKIADFGLARDIQNKEYYRKKTKGRLPVKWMAPEALSRDRYTSKSDVWSYGVLFWEILTLGETPYPTLQNVDRLLYTLRSGYRMEKPPNCSVESYSLMQKCWSLLPEDRPTFTMIIDDLDDILSNTDDQTLELSSFYQPDDEQCNPNDVDNPVDAESE